MTSFTGYFQSAPPVIARINWPLAASPLVPENDKTAIRFIFYKKKKKKHRIDETSNFNHSTENFHNPLPNATFEYSKYSPTISSASTNRRSSHSSVSISLLQFGEFLSQLKETFRRISKAVSLFRTIFR